MGEQQSQKVNRNICLGILAHVDAGKTTLSEAMLYLGGSIRQMGRVDNGDAFLDTDEMERKRGITIFSKQAVFQYEDLQFYLLDTPGHVDFSAEMERTLQVLDYCVLVISGADGVQSHTRTLWRLLERYQVPVFIFINKMDQQGTDRERLMANLRSELSGECIDFGNRDDDFWENVAMSEEKTLEHFLETGEVEEGTLPRLIRQRKVFPCFFGSALRMQGVEELLKGIASLSEEPSYPKEFGARVFKIARDAAGNRLTYLKVAGGSLKVRDLLGEEKVNQIRIYSGEKYEAVPEVTAGQVCAVTGSVQTRPGQGIGAEKEAELPILEPVLTYRVILPPEVDAPGMLIKLRILEEEEPELHLVWDEELKEIQVRIMGEVQLEMLQQLVWKRFGVMLEFGQGRVVYKETIAAPVVGVGHFEPLRHYAEVHLLLEPAEPDSGLVFEADCSEDLLAKNWQRLILTHLEEREHRGVLTGAPVTDMKITVVAGRAHLKHTEGGDFRQATYRAVRQGLMEAANVLLEPFYAFRLEVPERLIGRAMTDIEGRGGNFGQPELEKGTAILTGEAPVSTLRDYQKEVTAYTQGEGKLFCSLKGYRPCHNTEEVLSESGYDAEADLTNPTGSVFCAHGAGFVVPWDEVPNYKHIKTEEVSPRVRKLFGGEPVTEEQEYAVHVRPDRTGGEERVLGTDEIDRILERTYHSNRREEERKGIYRRRKPKETIPARTMDSYTYTPKAKKDAYLLVDGYNVIFTWEELRELAAVSIDGARGKLMDELCDYQASLGCELIVVFDAYRVQGHPTEIFDYHNIHVVYTKEAETADRYIERFATVNSKKYDVTVATSDGLEQIIIRSQGCRLLSARDLEKEVADSRARVREEYLEAPGDSGKIFLMDGFEDTVLELSEEETENEQ